MEEYIELEAAEADTVAFFIQQALGFIAVTPDTRELLRDVVDALTDRAVIDYVQ